MAKKDKPKTYEQIKKQHPDFIKALDDLGKATHEAGPLANKTAQLIQLAAAAASGSEGAVHSHVRRALAAGATADEIRHTLILLTSTIGFPQVVAALSWAGDVLDKKKGK